MALYVTRPRRDEERIGRGLPSAISTSSDVVYGICRGLPSAPCPFRLETASFIFSNVSI